jgi:predicted PurR-regulated permease PerM
MFPYFFESPTLAADIEAMASTFTSTMANLIFSSLKKIILNFPNIIMQTIIVLFTFFFAIRDQEGLKEYFLTISPFPKEYQEKFYLRFEQITSSILFGQIVVGVIQGIIAGIAYFVFRIPNALLLTLLTMLVGIIPVIGPWLVWIPVDFYLFFTGRIGAGIGLLLYGLFIMNWIDALIRPQIVSKKTKMNPGVVLIGMIGGLYFLGVAGLILGPLILAYLFLVIEFYKEKKFKSIIFTEINKSK